MASKIQSAQDLVDSYASITTISNAALWCAKAEASIGELESFASKAKAEADELSLLSKQQRVESREKSFLGRFFKSTDEKSTHSSIESLQGLIAISQKLVDRLQELVDITPRTREEQAVLVKELKLSKKNLQLQKKDIAAEMRGIRTDARQRSSSAATSLTTLLVGQKYTAAERRSIRQAKERALAPHEDAKSGIERQILAVEREILRLEAFR